VPASLPASVVVAHAGIATGGPLHLADAAAYDRAIEVNLLGSIRTIRALLPQVMKTRGYVLPVASMAGGVTVGVAYLTWTDTEMVRGADARPELGTMRATLPGVFGKTYPVVPAVARLMDAIVHRRSRVYAQPWVRAMNWGRGHGVSQVETTVPIRPHGRPKWGSLWVVAGRG
jgi:hypothetical protein